MQKNSTILYDLTPEQIEAIFKGVLQNQLTELKTNFQPKVPTEYLTRSEVAEMFKCDLSTVHNWTKQGKLIPYGIGNRVYYKRSEVESVLVPFGKNKGESKQ